jgi:hypothetical protein
MLRRVALVRTDVSEELRASFISVTRIGELGTTILDTLVKEVLSSYETSLLTRATRRNIPEDTILQSLLFLSFCLHSLNVCVENESHAVYCFNCNALSLLLCKTDNLYLART